MEFHLHRGRLQSDPHPQAAGDLMPTRKNPLLGRWRITEMELWDTDFVDMLEPAYITFEAKGGGEFVFGAVRGDLDRGYAKQALRFQWDGNEEMDATFGRHAKKCSPAGSLTGEICF